MTAIAPATALAALLPKPLASGSPLWIDSVTPRVSPTSSQHALRRNAGRILRRIARELAAVAFDSGDSHARLVAPFGADSIARLAQRQPENIEADAEVGDGRGAKASAVEIGMSMLSLGE